MVDLLEGDPFFNSRSTTFAEPGSGTFSQKLADMGKEAALGVQDYMDIMGAPGAAVGQLVATEKRRGRASELIGAAFDQSRINGQLWNEGLAMERAADLRIDRIREETGMALENPFRQGYYMEARTRLESRRAAGEKLEFTGPAILAEARNIFNERVNLAAERFPEKAAALTFMQPFEDQAQALKLSAEGRRAAAEKGVAEPGARFAAELAGGLGAMATDPIQLAGLMAGGGPGTAATTIGKFGQVMLREAGINAALEAVQQPTIQAWRAKMGLEAGLGPAAENMALAGLFGAGGGALIQGGRTLAGKIDADAVRRVLDGTGSAADIDRTLKAFGVPIDDESRAFLREAATREADAAAASGVKPARIDSEAHAEAMEMATRHALDPDAPPATAPLIAVEKPKTRIDMPDLRDEAPPLGAEFRMMGKPVAETRVDPVRLETDATTFQYKENSDATGVTDRLKGVDAIAPLATGKLVVFERADGVRVVADGHQRTGLFKRLADDAGEVPIAVAPGVAERGRLDVPAFLFREADGWTPADVRAVAAIKNIQEGSGSLVDTARVLRDNPQLLDATLPITRGQTQQALGLAALSDDAWGMALNSRLDPAFSSWVGRIAPDRPELHAALLADLIRADPPNATAAQFLIRDALAAGFRRETQMTMFGQLEASVSLLKERSEVFASAKRQLEKDKSLFALLKREADAITAVEGNVLNADANTRAGEQLAQLMDLFDTVATRAGPVSDMLNTRAHQVAEGMGRERAAKEFAADLLEMIRREGVPGLLKEPELKPRVAIEPGSKEAQDLVETFSREDLEAAGQGSMFGDAPATKPLPATINEGKLADAVQAVDDAGARLDFFADLTASCKG